MPAQYSTSDKLSIDGWSSEDVISWLRGVELPQKLLAELSNLNGREMSVLTASDIQDGLVDRRAVKRLLTVVSRLLELQESINNVTLQSLLIRLHLNAKQSASRIIEVGTQVTNSPPVSASLDELSSGITKVCWLLGRPPFRYHEEFMNLLITLENLLNSMAVTWDKVRDNENDFKAILLKQLERLSSYCCEVACSESESLLISACYVETVHVDSYRRLQGILLTITDDLTFLIVGDDEKNASEESSVGRMDGIDPGDEILAVNNQVTLGWTRKSFLQLLRESSNGVAMTLKKMPRHRNRYSRSHVADTESNVIIPQFSSLQFPVGANAAETYSAEMFTITTDG